MYRRKYVRYMNQKIQYNAAVYIQSWFKGILYQNKYISYMKYQQHYGDYKNLEMWLLKKKDILQ